MTSASEAVKRLKGESLQQKSLTQLKEDAADLELSKDDIKAYGNLSYKQTWVDAINDTVGKLFDEPEVSFDPNPVAEPVIIPMAAIQHFLNNPSQPIPPVEEILAKYPLSELDKPNPVQAFADDYFTNHIGEPVPASFLTLLQESEPSSVHNQPSSVHNEVESTVQPIETQTISPAKLFDIEDVDPEVIPYILEQAANPLQLPKFKQTIELFKNWEPWMIPGGKFVTPDGRIYKIEYVDRWSNVHAIAPGMKDSACLEMNLVAQYNPVYETQQDSQSSVQPIQQRYEAEDVEDGNGNTIWFIRDRETCQWICENAGDYQGYSTKEEASQRVKELCVTANRNTQTEPQPEPQRIDCFIPKAIHYPKHEIYRIWDTLNDAWVQDEQGYDTKEEAQKRIQQLAQ